MKKRIFTAILTLALCMTTLTTNAFAYVWYSNENTVRFHDGTPSIRVKKLYTTSTFTRELLEGYVSTAASEWRSGTKKLPNSFTSGSGTGVINVYGGSPTSLEGEGLSPIGSNGGVVNGSTTPTSSVVTTLTIDGTARTIRRMSGATVYLVNKQASGTYNGVSYSSRSNIGHQNTTKHELGHALGWGGHSSDTNDVMTTTTSNTVSQSPTTRDYTQVRQFIDAYAASTASLTIMDDSIETDSINVNLDVAVPTDERIKSIASSTRFVDNVIVGTPIERIQGTDEVLSPDEEGCEILITDYVFEVNNCIFGNEVEQTITVRSQIGDAFEIGKEYTFAAMRIDNAYYDQYNVVSHSWIVDNDKISKAEENTLSSLGSKRTSPRERNTVNTQASASQQYIDSIDIAIIATIVATEKNDLAYDNIDALLELKETLKGKISSDALGELIQLKGDVEVGETYLLLLDADQEGNISLSSKEGSIININDSSFTSYNELLK